MVEFDKKEKLYEPSEVAELYGVSTVSVTKWLKKKEMVGFKFGKKWKIPESSIKTFIDKSTST